MVEQKKEEIKEFKNQYNSIIYDNKKFRFYIGNSAKYIFGSTTPEDDNSIVGKVSEYRTLYDSLMSTDEMIKLSLDKAIEYTYTHNILLNFNPLSEQDVDEKLAYYYIENAVFRELNLWDLLAQLYCLHYKIDKDINKIYYKNIFNPRSPHSNKFKKEAIEIEEYLNEKDTIENFETNDQWIGNHQFIVDFRNKMTHRNSPNKTTISNFDINIKTHPTVILKRLIEDYVVVSKYLDQILSVIEGYIFETLEKEK